MSAACEKCGEPCDLEGSSATICALCIEALTEAEAKAEAYTGPLTDGTHVRVEWSEEEKAYIGRLTLREPNGLHRRVTMFAAHRDIAAVLHSLAIKAREFLG